MNARELIIKEIRKLRDKSRQKIREADRLESEAKKLEDELRRNGHGNKTV